MQKTHESFVRLAESLSGLCDLLRGDLQRRAVEGSPAWLETHPETLSGALGKTPSLNAIYGASLLTVSAVDHAHATAALMQTDGVINAVATTARGSVEALAQANYLLSAVDARDRVRRYTNLKLHDLASNRRLAEHVVDDPAERARFLKAARDRVADLVRASEQARFKVIDKGNDKTPQLEPRRPSMTGLCAQLVNEADPAVGKIVYSMLSSIAHSSTSGLMRNVIPQLPDLSKQSGGLRTAASGITLKDLAINTYSVPLGLGLVSDRLYDMMGWQQGGRRAAAAMSAAMWAAAVRD